MPLRGTLLYHKKCLALTQGGGVTLVLPTPLISKSTKASVAINSFEYHVRIKLTTRCTEEEPSRTQVIRRKRPTERIVRAGVATLPSQGTAPNVIGYVFTAKEKWYRFKLQTRELYY